MSYDLTKTEELYNFSKDCEEACCTCPQYKPWNPIDFDECRNNVSPVAVFMYWKGLLPRSIGAYVLFTCGYCANLNTKAKNTFERYVVRQTYNDKGREIEPDVVDLASGKTLSAVPIKILTFCNN